MRPSKGQYVIFIIVRYKVIKKILCSAHNRASLSLISRPVNPIVYKAGRAAHCMLVHAKSEQLSYISDL